MQFGRVVWAGLASGKRGDETGAMGAGMLRLPSIESICLLFCSMMQKIMALLNVEFSWLPKKINPARQTAA